MSVGGAQGVLGRTAVHGAVELSGNPLQHQLLPIELGASIQEAASDPRPCEHGLREDFILCGSGQGGRRVTGGTHQPERARLRGLAPPGLETQGHPMGWEWLPRNPRKSRTLGLDRTSRSTSCVCAAFWTGEQKCVHILPFLVKANSAPQTRRLRPAGRAGGQGKGLRARCLGRHGPHWGPYHLPTPFLLLRERPT